VGVILKTRYSIDSSRAGLGRIREYEKQENLRPGRLNIEKFGLEVKSREANSDYDAEARYKKK